jgi:hypothetical protein
MKRTLSSLTIIFCLGALAWAQGTKTELFDVKKSQQELEIMKGILATTINFVAQNLQAPTTKEAAPPSGQATASTSPRVVTTPFGSIATTGTKTVMTPFGPTAVSTGTFRLSSSSINAFYLYGQGAVFVIPASNLRFGIYGSTYNEVTRSEDATRQVAEARVLLQAQENALAKARQGIQRVRSGVGQGTGSGAGQGVAGGVAGSAPPPQPAQPPKVQAASPATVAPVPNVASQEDLQKKLAQLQEQAKNSREDQEQQRARLTEALGKIKTYLIEALANYGDSLTTIKPNEYVTLVIMTDDASALFGGDRASSHCELISAQKSWITDYKAGKLTLDAFKQKVLQYSE